VLMLTAARHKLLRKKLGFTQADLAHRSGVSLGSIKRFERTGQISFDGLLRLAHTLDRLQEFETLFTFDTEKEAAERLFSHKTKVK